MNKSFYKLTVSLVLAVVALLLLLFVTFIGFSAVWLKTYRAFTAKKLIAEITVSEQKKDDKGVEYFDIKYKPLNDQSALSKVFTNQSAGLSLYDTETSYKFYGDEFEVGGQVVKFDNWANLIGFTTIYKVSRLQGDYVEAEKAKSATERSIVELNGGVDNTWKFLEANEQKVGFLVDTVYGSYATKFIQGREKTYGLYITEDGFILDQLYIINN